jgi:hypothetical protein
MLGGFTRSLSALVHFTLHTGAGVDSVVYTCLNTPRIRVKYYVRSSLHAHVYYERSSLSIDPECPPAVYCRCLDAFSKLKSR